MVGSRPAMSGHHCPDCLRDHVEDDDVCPCGIARPLRGWSSGAGRFAGSPVAEPSRILQPWQVAPPMTVSLPPPPAREATRGGNVHLATVDFSEPPTLPPRAKPAPVSPAPQESPARVFAAGSLAGLAMCLLAMGAWALGRWG